MASSASKRARSVEAGGVGTVAKRARAAGEAAFVSALLRGVHASWLEVLEPLLQTPEGLAPVRRLQEALEAQTATICPPKEHVFQALRLTPFNRVKAVVLGQDPYHNDGQAMGLAFSVNSKATVKMPPSLPRILSEAGVEFKGSGDLTTWAKQGVLLLNSVLTVEKGKAGSHHSWGWQHLTDRLLFHLSNHTDNRRLVFMLWGNKACEKEKLIDTRKHHVLKAAHPSPLASRGGFLGCAHFTLANDLLRQQGLLPIVWDTVNADAAAWQKVHRACHQESCVAETLPQEFLTALDAPLDFTHLRKARTSVPKEEDSVAVVLSQEPIGETAKAIVRRHESRREDLATQPSSSEVLGSKTPHKSVRKTPSKKAAPRRSQPAKSKARRPSTRKAAAPSDGHDTEPEDAAPADSGGAGGVTLDDRLMKDLGVADDASATSARGARSDIATVGSDEPRCPSMISFLSEAMPEQPEETPELMSADADKPMRCHVVEERRNTPVRNAFAAAPEAESVDAVEITQLPAIGTNSAELSEPTPTASLEGPFEATAPSMPSDEAPPVASEPMVSHPLQSDEVLMTVPLGGMPEPPVILEDDSRELLEAQTEQRPIEEERLASLNDLQEMPREAAAATQAADDSSEQVDSDSMMEASAAIQPTDAAEPGMRHIIDEPSPETDVKAADEEATERPMPCFTDTGEPAVGEPVLGEPVLGEVAPFAAEPPVPELGAASETAADSETAVGSEPVMEAAYEESLLEAVPLEVEEVAMDEVTLNMSQDMETTAAVAQVTEVTSEMGEHDASGVTCEECTTPPIATVDEDRFNTTDAVAGDSVDACMEDVVGVSEGTSVEDVVMQTTPSGVPATPKNSKASSVEASAGGYAYDPAEKMLTGPRHTTNETCP